MKVLSDYQTVVRQETGGISRYHFELVKNINEIFPDVSVNVKCLFSRNYYFEEYFNKKAYHYKSKIIRNIVLIINDIYTFFVILLSNLFFEKYDVVHITWYKAYYIRLLKKILGKKCPKLVMTVHDLIHEMECDKDPVLKKGVRDRKNMLKIADQIIVISKNTKDDLLLYYPWVDEAKITIIYHGFLQNSKINDHNVNSLHLPKKFIFFVGKRNGYKNFKNFILAMSKLKNKYPELFIVCAGGGTFSMEEKELIDKNHLSKSIVQKFMSDEELNSCYSNAKCFVFPSLYEGFGMPILEAFSFGCPIALSNASCFPEIAGDAGVYFDGTNVDDIALKVEKLYTLSEDNKQDLIKREKTRLKLFSWEKTARETVKVYRS